MEDLNGGGKRKVVEEFFPPPSILLEQRNATIGAKRPRVGDSANDAESIESNKNLFPEGNSSSAVMALSIVLQHWIIPDLGCSFDPLKERLPSLLEETCTDFMRKGDETTRKYVIEYRLNNWMTTTEDYFVSDYKDITITKLRNLSVESLLSPDQTIPGITITHYLTEDDDPNDNYYKCQDLRDIVDKLYADYWFHFSKLFQIDSIKASLVLKDTYDEFTSSMSIFFQKQQEHFGNARGGTDCCPSMLIIYQLYAFQRFRESILIRLEKLLVYIATLPSIIELDRIKPKFSSSYLNNYYYSTDNAISSLETIRDAIADHVINHRIGLLESIISSSIQRLQSTIITMQLYFEYIANPNKYLIKSIHEQKQDQQLNNEILNEIIINSIEKGNTKKATKLTAKLDHSEKVPIIPCRFECIDIMKALDIIFNCYSWLMITILKWNQQSYDIPIGCSDDEKSLPMVTIQDRQIYYVLRNCRLDLQLFTNLSIIMDIFAQQRYYANSYQQLSNGFAIKYKYLQQLFLSIGNTTLTLSERDTLCEKLSIIDHGLYQSFKTLAIRRQMIEHPIFGYTYHYQAYGLLTRRELSFLYDKVMNCIILSLEQLHRKEGYENQYRELLTPKYDDHNMVIPINNAYIRSIKVACNHSRRLYDSLYYAYHTILPKAIDYKLQLLEYSLTRYCPSEVMYDRPLVGYYLHYNIHDSTDDDRNNIDKIIMKLKDGLTLYYDEYCDSTIYTMHNRNDDNAMEFMLFLLDVRRKAVNTLQYALHCMIGTTLTSYRSIHRDRVTMYELFGEIYDSIGRIGFDPCNDIERLYKRLGKIANEVDELFTNTQTIWRIITCIHDSTDSDMLLFLYQWKLKAIRLRLLAILLVIEMKIDDPYVNFSTVKSWEDSDEDDGSDDESMSNLPYYSHKLHLIKEVHDLTDALFVTIDKLFPLLDNPSDAQLLLPFTSEYDASRDGNGTYWHFLTTLFFWLEKALEGIIICQFEVHEIPGSRITVYDKIEIDFQKMYSSMKSIVVPTCNYVDSSNVYHFKSFVTRKHVDVTMLVRYLQRNLDYVSEYDLEIQYAESPEDVILREIHEVHRGKDEDDERNEQEYRKMAEDRINVVKAFLVDRPKVIQTLVDMVGYWQKEVKVLIDKKCQQDTTRNYKLTKTFFSRQDKIM